MTNSKKTKTWVKGHVRRDKRTGKVSYVKGHFRDLEKIKERKEYLRSRQPKTKKELLDNEINLIILQSIPEEKKDYVVDLAFTNSSIQLSRKMSDLEKERLSAWKNKDFKKAIKLDDEINYFLRAKLLRKGSFPY